MSPQALHKYLKQLVVTAKLGAAQNTYGPDPWYTILTLWAEVKIHPSVSSHTYQFKIVRMNAFDRKPLFCSCAGTATEPNKNNPPFRWRQRHLLRAFFVTIVLLESNLKVQNKITQSFPTLFIFLTPKWNSPLIQSRSNH